MKPCGTIIRGAAITAILICIASAEPITLHPGNPHYYLFRNQAIALIASGEHYGAVLNADFDFHRYLATLASAGLNYTRLFSGTYVEVPAQSFGILRNDLAPAPGRYLTPWARSTVAGYTGGGNKFDLQQWNQPYFERLHEFLSEAANRGIIVEITLFSSQYDPKQWRLSPFNPANNVNATSAIDWKKLETLENGNILAYQEHFTRKLVREVNPFDNVILEIQNEPWSDRPTHVKVVNPYLQPPTRDNYPNVIDLADGLSLAWQARLAAWIKSEEASLPNKHLIAQNYCNFGFPVRTLVPGASIVNFHYAYPTAVLANYGLGKAISYDETGFLGQADDGYRRQAWNFMLSGGSAFDNLDYSFSVGHEDGTDTSPNGPGGGSPRLRRQLSFLSSFLQALPLLDMRPDTQIVKHAAGANVHGLADPGHEYALYLDGGGSIELTLDLPPGKYRSQWVNVETGAAEDSASFRHAGGSKVLWSPNSQNGVALRLQIEPRP